MVDPSNITNYNLTDAELEEYLLFWVTAAGKNGRTSARCLEVFLTMITYNNMSPFTAIKSVEMDVDTDPYIPKVVPTLSEILKSAGIGCYNSKSETFSQLAFSGLNLRTCSAEDLEKIYGIGMKTSRCFILHSREGARYAGLDTHMLKHLTEMGVENVPKTTPSSKKLYLTLEKEVLSLADKADVSPASYDLSVWNNYSAK